MFALVCVTIIQSVLWTGVHHACATTTLTAHLVPALFILFKVKIMLSVQQFALLSQNFHLLSIKIAWYVDLPENQWNRETQMCNAVLTRSLQGGIKFKYVYKNLCLL